MFNVENLAPGIEIYRNASGGLENLQIIKDIEDAVYQQAIKWEMPYIVSNGNAFIDTNIRDLQTFGIQYEQSKSIIENPSNIFDSAANVIGNRIFNILDPVEKDYQGRYAILLENHDVYSVLKYGEGHFFNNHIDDHPARKRTMSILYYLNDDYDGGEISFPRFNISIKPEADSVLIFPSAYVYNHSVSKVTSGTRYTVVSWLA